MKGSDQNKKPSANEEKQSLISRASYWSPTIGAGIPFIISLRYLPQTLEQNQGNIPYDHNSYMQNEEEGDFGYQYYLPYIPTIILGSFFVSTFFCNSIFGRASNRDSHHNPFYHQIIQGAGDYMPAASAVLYSIFRFGARSIGGERAEAVEELMSEGLAALNIASRINDKVDESYDYRMDRSTLLDGNVRRIEYIDIIIRDGIVYIVELGLHGAYYAMEMGVTRIAVNDANRLYIITALYSGADSVEESLVYILNQFTHYAERISDFSVISSILRSIGVANPSKPIKAVTPRKLDQAGKEIKKEMKDFHDSAKKLGERLKEGAQQLGNELKEGAEKLGEDIQEGAEQLGENIQGGLEAIGNQIATVLHIPHHTHSSRSSHSAAATLDSSEGHVEGSHRSSFSFLFNRKDKKSSSNSSAEKKGNPKDDREHKATSSSSAEKKGDPKDDREHKATSSSSAEKKGDPKDERDYEEKITDDHSSSSSTNDSFFGLFHGLFTNNEAHHGEALHGLGAQEVIHNLLHGAHESVAVGTEGFGPFTQVISNPNGSMTGTLSNGAMLNFPTTPNTYTPHTGLLGRIIDHRINLGHVDKHKVFSYYDTNKNLIIMIGDVEIKILPGDHHS